MRRSEMIYEQCRYTTQIHKGREKEVPTLILQRVRSNGGEEDGQNSSPRNMLQSKMHFHNQQMVFLESLGEGDQHIKI